MFRPFEAEQLSGSPDEVLQPVAGAGGAAQRPRAYGGGVFPGLPSELALARPLDGRGLQIASGRSQPALKPTAGRPASASGASLSSPS